MLQRRLLTLLIVMIAPLAGCGKRVLVPSPNLYVHVVEDPFGDVPPVFQTSTVDLLYVTDRNPTGNTIARKRYGYKRSPSMAFGTCTVEIGEDMTWDELVAASCTDNRRYGLPLTLTHVEELGRSPETPGPLEVVDGVAIPTVAYKAERDASIAEFHEELHRRLALSPRKSVLIFVHGFNNTLEDAAYRLAEMWHFLGREGVPLLYTWPAAHPGMLLGYTADREASEFTVFHLKELLRAVAACPEVEEVHIVSHSLGCDVSSTALRELCMTALAAGLDPQKVYKIENAVYAAPDIDLNVSNQRYAAEQTDRIAVDNTIYVTANDRALGSAEWLFDSPHRLGKMRPENMPESYRERLSTTLNSEIIDSRVTTDYLGHAYFLANPATLSDLILLLRYDRLPGAEHGRPLTELIHSWFILNDDYPMEAAPVPEGMHDE